MTEFASLRDALDSLREAQNEYADDVTRFVVSVEERFTTEARLYDELRDDMHALANRVETLVRVVMADPSDVAGSVIRLHGGDAA